MRLLNVFLVLILAGVLGGRFTTPQYTIVIQQQDSGISTSEDPQARANYEAALLADPATGQVPDNMRRKEIHFTRTLPARNAHLSTPNHRVAERNYELAGPFNVGGRTREIALDIRNENTIIAGGVSGSIWKSTDRGSSWRRTSDPTNRNSVTALAQDTRPEREDVWYYGTGELVGNSARTLVAPYRGNGIYKSTDGGESWELLASTDQVSPDQFASQFQYIWSIETNHTNQAEDEILVAAYGGILRSLDGGTTWTTVLGEKLFDLEAGTDLNTSNAPFYTSIRKTTEGHFFATLSSATSTNALYPDDGLYFSTDGNSFINITPASFPSYHERTVIGMSGDERQVYFLTEEGGDARVSFWRLDISSITSAGLTGQWTELSQNLPEFGGDFGDYNTQFGYNMVVEVHPENPNVIYMGGTNLYRSVDGFTTNQNTRWIGGYSPSNTGAVYPDHYPDQHFLLFFPSDPNRMLSANDGGVRMTNNNLADSVRWTSLNNGYITSQFYTVAQQPDKATPQILGGMQDNGSYLRDATVENPSWNRILGGDGGYCAITSDQHYFYVSFQESQIYRLTLTETSRQLTSFARVDPVGGGEDPGWEYLFINPFVLDPLNENRMYLAGGNIIWKNTNLAQIPGGSQEKTRINWTSIPATRTTGGLYTALEKAKDRDILYAGTVGQTPEVFRIEDVSTTQEKATTITSPLFPSGGHIICIAVNPENADHFVVVFSNYHVPSLFMTEDGGQSFEDISGNLEQFPDGSGDGPSVRWAEIIPKTDGYEYFVGTSVGLYAADDLQGNNTVWMKESEDKIGNAVIAMMDYRARDGRLVIATHGNGTYQIYLEDTRLPNHKPAPEQVMLAESFPNPFNDKTMLEFTIPEGDEVRIDVFDNKGRLIRNLLWAPQFAGKSQAVWDGTNTSGVPVKQGLYHLVLNYRDKQLSKRVIYRP